MTLLPVERSNRPLRKFLWFLVANDNGKQCFTGVHTAALECFSFLSDGQDEAKQSFVASCGSI